MIFFYEKQRQISTFLRWKSTAASDDGRFEFPDARLDIPPVHQQIEILLCKVPRFFRIPWPMKRTAGNPFVAEQKSVAFVGDRLDTVFPAAAEEKQGMAERVKFHVLGNNSYKSIDAFAQVGAAAADIDMIEFCNFKIIKHSAAPEEPS